MRTYAALFRGINVGGRNILPMKDLVAMLTDMGFEEVRTYIQSGNVVFHSRKKCTKKTAGEISARVRKSHGFSPHVLLLESSDLRRAIENNPFATADGKALHLYFLDSTPEHPDLEGLAGVQSGSERFRLRRNVFYLHAPHGIGRSKLAARVEKRLGTPATARNWNTVTRLASMVRA